MRRRANEPGGRSGGGRVAREPRFTLGATTSVPALLVKVLALGCTAGVVIWLTPLLLAAGDWLVLAGVWVIAAAIFAVYAGPRPIAGKYLLPGSVFLAVFVIVPIVYNVQISTTNFGDGTRGTKAEAIDTILEGSYQPVEGGAAYALSVGATAQERGEHVLLLVDESTGLPYRGDRMGLTPLDADEVSIVDGRIETANGYTVLTPKEVNALGAGLQELAVPTDRGVIRVKGTSVAIEEAARLSYDEVSDAIVDQESGERYEVHRVGDRSVFVDGSGARAFDQSWQEPVGLANYVRLFTDPALRDSFFSAFAWSAGFAVGSVALAFGLGLLLASTLNEPLVRGRPLYRAVLIVPYAIPTFVSFLVWSTFYNRDFGLINQLLGADIDWLGDPALAKTAILLANLWASFPYMFLICTGALQSLPRELDEAAAIDGAGPVTAFLKVRFPMLLVAVAPLLVAAFAFNFNNFNAIQLLTGGGPFAPGAEIGQTDILISAVYRIAFGDSGARFGLAAAGSTILFIITAVLAAVQFRATKQLEDLR